MGRYQPMIAQIINSLIAVSPEVGQRYGLCEKKDDIIYHYVGGGNGQQVNVDQNGSWSYFRITGKLTRNRDNTFRGCDGWRYTIPIRYVLVNRRDNVNCNSGDQIMSASAAFIAARRAIETSVSALLVNIDRAETEIDTTRAFRNEVGQKDPPLEISFQYTDLTVEVLLDHECLNLC